MTNRVLLLIFAFVTTMLYRFFVNLNIRYVSMSKSEYKNYQKDYSIVYRWFFIKASNYCKDKYSRGEHKTVHHKKHVVLYSLFTILLHLFLLCLIFAFILRMKGVISQVLCDRAYMVYYVFFLFSIIPIYFIEGIRNRELHKKRHR